jgi:hypothetical protein
MVPRSGGLARTRSTRWVQVERGAGIKQVNIRGFVHKGLKKAVPGGQPKGSDLLAGHAGSGKAASIPVVEGPSSQWTAQGVWSLHVTRIWRLTKPGSSRLLSADRSYRGPRPFRDKRRQDLARFAADALQSPKCQNPFIRRYGASLREGVRRRYRDPDENAEFLRHRADAKPRKEDSGGPVGTASGGVSLVAAPQPKTLRSKAWPQNCHPIEPGSLRSSRSSQISRDNNSLCRALDLFGFETLISLCKRCIARMTAGDASSYKLLHAHANRRAVSAIASAPTFALSAAMKSLYCSNLYFCQSASLSLRLVR